jgi:DNA-binding XRE family transcriptional regulator
MQTLDDYIAEQVSADPDFAGELAAAQRETEFAFQLARLREARRLTQRELADLAGIKQPQLARIERGQTPTLPTLKRLAQALKARIVIEPEGEATRILLQGYKAPAAAANRRKPAVAAR